MTQAYEQIKNLARAKVAAGEFKTEEQAVVAVCRERPDLYRLQRAQQDEAGRQAQEQARAARARAWNEYHEKRKAGERLPAAAATAPGAPGPRQVNESFTSTREELRQTRDGKWYLTAWDTGSERGPFVTAMEACTDAEQRGATVTGEASPEAA